MTEPLKVKLDQPHAGQQLVLDQAKRFNVVCCGVRWGKTKLGINRAALAALNGLPVAWFGTSYRNVSEVWRELKDLLQPVTVDVSEQEHRLELIGGGSIEVWSMENYDNCRGRRYGLIVVDEAAHSANLESAWTLVMRQRLTDLKGGAWFISTPRGNSNYFAKLYARGQDPAYPSWASWQMPTTSNPLIDPAEVEEARAELPELSFAQEYLAQLVSWEGQVFRKIGGAVVRDMPAGPQNGRTYSIGVDWGKSHDFTVFAVVDDQGQCVEIDRSRGLDYGLQRGRLAALRAKWNGAFCVAEANSMGGPVIEDLHREGLPVQPFWMSNASKAEIVENLSLAFEQGRVRIPDDPVLIGELQSFEASPLPSGMMRYAAGGSGHDDTVIALAIGLYAAGGGMTPVESRIVTAEELWPDMDWQVRISPY